MAPEIERDLYESEALERVGLTTESPEVEHCGSCHSDADDGYAMNGCTFADGRYAEVCCGVAEYLYAHHPDKLEARTEFR